jgi:hypothetical protein
MGGPPPQQVIYVKNDDDIKCCGCCPVKTGFLIIAILQTIAFFSYAFLFTVIIALFNSGDIYEQYRN